MHIDAREVERVGWADVQALEGFAPVERPGRPVVLDRPVVQAEGRVARRLHLRDDHTTTEGMKMARE